MKTLTNKNKTADIFGFIGYLLSRATKNIAAFGFFAVAVGSVSVIVVRAYQQSVERHGGDFWWWFRSDIIITCLIFWSPFIGGFITACILSLVEYLGKMYTDYKIGIVNKSAEHDWEPIDTYDEER